MAWGFLRSDVRHPSVRHGGDVGHGERFHCATGPGCQFIECRKFFVDSRAVDRAGAEKFRPPFPGVVNKTG